MEIQVIQSTNEVIVRNLSMVDSIKINSVCVSAINHRCEI